MTPRQLSYPRSHTSLNVTWTKSGSAHFHDLYFNFPIHQHTSERFSVSLLLIKPDIAVSNV